jgi:hypothetical protein
MVDASTTHRTVPLQMRPEALREQAAPAEPDVEDATDTNTEADAEVDEGKLDAMRETLSDYEEDLERSIRAGEEAWGGDVEEIDDDADLELDVMRAIQAIGGGVIAIAIVVVVVNAVMTTEAVNNSSGPFQGVIDSLNTTGVSAMVLLVIGLLVGAASRLMGMFSSGF